MISQKAEPSEILSFLQDTLFAYRDLQFPTLNEYGTRKLIAVDQVAALIAFEKVEESELNALLNDSQNSVVADFINDEILGKLLI